MENGKYKYEIHCHTDETSWCGKVPADELVEIYKSKGYDGVVITDHYSQMTFREFKIFKSRYMAEKFLRGYRKAKAAAGDDFTVLLGMELRGWNSAIDYLVYGVTEEFIENSGNLLFKYARRFYKIAKANGFLVIAPHPYRMNPFMPALKCIDGCEIYNSKESAENNANAAKWADKHNLKIRTSGTDFHRRTHEKFSGILTDERITSNDDLLRILRSGNFELILNGE